MYDYDNFGEDEPLVRNEPPDAGHLTQRQVVEIVEAAIERGNHPHHNSAPRPNSRRAQRVAKKKERRIW